MTINIQELPKFFYFDLEETLIDSWVDTLLCNKEKVEAFIKQHNVKEVHIFSAAIWDDYDKNIFEKNLKGWLEGVYNISIVSWPSMKDVWAKTNWKTVKFVNVSEFIMIIGKKRMFEDWCKLMHHRDSHCILLDDSFEEESLINKVHNTIIEVVDINKVVI